MKLKLVLFFVLISASFYGQSFKEENSFFSDIHKKGKLQGKVVAANSNNPLVFANITIKELNLTTTSDFNGNYSFKLEPGNYTILFNFIGYKSKLKNITTNSNDTTICNESLNILTSNSYLVMNMERN